MSGPPLAALLTPSGRGAIATIRVALGGASRSTIDAWPFRAANGRPLSAQTLGRIVFGRWGSEPAEEVVLCAVDEATCEIHCHGGEAAARRILRDLADAGCQVVAWPELLRETESPLRAEIMSVLSRATTLPTAAILWEQANGVFESAVTALIAEATDRLSVAPEQLREWLAWTDFGLHLTRSWRVVFAGRPNVGKSSLSNAILGYTRSIVFDQPGTTRDVVSAQTAIDGWPIELSDTAGLRASADPLESAGIARARQTLETADLVVALIDISQQPSAADRSILAEQRPQIVVAHKCDLPMYEGCDGWQSEEMAAWLPVSAKTGSGVKNLIAAISRRLVPRVPPPDCLIPLTERHVVLFTRGLAAADRGDAAGLVQSLRHVLDGADGAVDSATC